MRLSLLSLLPVALAAPAALLDRAAKPVYWLLAGDSTTATGKGWGDAFLSTTVASGSSGHNYAHSGATTKSFRDGGDWAKVIKDIGTYKKDHRVYVTIQFGHNDQKKLTLAEYTTNLGKFAAEVVTAGATPILVTSLTRRSFDSKTKKVKDSLKNERVATIDVATSGSYHYIDLNTASADYVNAIGSTEAQKYNLAADDTTHLNKHGGEVFSRIVADLVLSKYPTEFDGFVKKNDALSALIKAGKPA
ncbi:hypothetical protein NX059_004968 [Plenodomus lindquistii]|nr:hypothetical protein NX059_004968 [Plenodomus lindquistii]